MHSHWVGSSPWVLGMLVASRAAHAKSTERPCCLPSNPSLQVTSAMIPTQKLVLGRQPPCQEAWIKDSIWCLILELFEYEFRGRINWVPVSGFCSLLTISFLAVLWLLLLTVFSFPESCEAVGVFGWLWDRGWSGGDTSVRFRGEEDNGCTTVEPQSQ